MVPVPYIFKDLIVHPMNLWASYIKYLNKDIGTPI